MGWIGRTISAVNTKRKSSEVIVAITGLSKSGKTSFITSVIANLEASAITREAAEHLRGLAVVDTDRLKAVALVKNNKVSLNRRFPYETAVACLTSDDPRWPSSTTGVSEIALDLRFWPGRRPDQINAPAACCRLTLIDYPGEWLADIPMLEQSYAEWSRDAWLRLEKSPWADASQGFKKFLSEHDWTKPYDAKLVKAAALEWQKTLLIAQSDSLKWLQPARLVRNSDPNGGDDIPILKEEWLQFCPLPPSNFDSIKRGSSARRILANYEAYKKKTLEFFKITFRNASRHIIMVDMLDALSQGERPYHETGEILSRVYSIMNENNTNFWSFMNRGSFDKFILLATKADTIPPHQRPSLPFLLKEMCARRLSGVADIPDLKLGFVAAVRATKDIETDPGAEDSYSIVAGKEIGTNQILEVVSFNIPSSIPTSLQFATRRNSRKIPRFTPLQIAEGADRGIPNVRLGQALNEILEDLLR